MEWYRDDLEEDKQQDPFPKLRKLMLTEGWSALELKRFEDTSIENVAVDFAKARTAANPTPADLYTHAFAPTPITTEVGTRQPEGAEVKVMVDSALIAIEELMHKHPECLLYGQDVGSRLGGVFRKPQHSPKNLETTVYLIHRYRRLLL